MAEVGTRHRFVIVCGHVQGDSIIMNLNTLRTGIFSSIFITNH
jgi:hypothetical protein